VRRRTGFDLRGDRSTAFSAWRPERLCCATFAQGPVMLCGDAAHVMSPIGGQGMNTGFADAALAADALCRAQREDSWADQCARYTFRRRRVFRAAADRAALGMWLGTRTGTAARLGGLLLRHGLLRPALARRLARHFAMWTLPFGPARAPRCRP
jgi:2-polyprenyl-6-methoxyphenol hydroxylase-like FAD-dependent oxidoreductase